MTDAPALALTVLGTGDAFASGGHPHSCYLAEPLRREEGEARALLIDCGPTAVPTLQGMNFDLGKIDLVLLTHHHGDHIAGIAFLYLNYQFMVRRETSLTVAGPPGTEEKCEEIFRANYGETADLMKRRFELNYIELVEDREQEVCGLNVLPKRVTHMRKGIPYGYRIRWKGRSFGLSGDTEWDENLIDLAEGTDLFLAECFSAGEKIPFHTSLKDLERESDRLRTRRLLLTHMGEDVRRLTAAGKSLFEAARDGQRIEF